MEKNSDKTQLDPFADLAGFWGKKSQTLDDKGRTTIPSKFLAYLKETEAGSTVWITKDYDFCLRVYTTDGWRSFLQSLDQAEPDEETVETIEALRDIAIPNCEPIEVNEKTGRITIPSMLREYAGLNPNDKVLFIGNGSKGHFVIWSEQRWESHERESIKTVRQNRKKLAGTGVKY